MRAVLTDIALQAKRFVTRRVLKLRDIGFCVTCQSKFAAVNMHGPECIDCLWDGSVEIGELDQINLHDAVPYSAEELALLSAHDADLWALWNAFDEDDCKQAVVPMSFGEPLPKS